MGAASSQRFHHFTRPTLCYLSVTHTGSAMRFKSISLCFTQPTAQRPGRILKAASRLQTFVDWRCPMMGLSCTWGPLEVGCSGWARPTLPNRSPEEQVGGQERPISARRRKANQSGQAHIDQTYESRMCRMPEQSRLSPPLRQHTPGQVFPDLRID
jgi:hypothetical protein